MDFFLKWGRANLQKYWSCSRSRKFLARFQTFNFNFSFQRKEKINIFRERLEGEKQKKWGGREGGGNVELCGSAKCSWEHDQLEGTRYWTPQAWRQDPCHRWTIQLKNDWGSNVQWKQFVLDKNNNMNRLRNIIWKNSHTYVFFCGKLRLLKI